MSYFAASTRLHRVSSGTPLWLYRHTYLKKNTIHQVTAMLATSKNVLFPGHNHLLPSGTDDPTLIIAQAPARLIILVSGHQHQWLVGGCDLEIEHF